MEARKLRIGNLVQYKDTKEVCTIYQLEHRFKDTFRINDINNNDKLEPIPLTKEWLERFGFEYLDFRNKYQIDSFPLQLQNNDVWEWYVMDYDIFPTIKYVNELQNLYYVLSGKELTLNK